MQPTINSSELPDALPPPRPTQSQGMPSQADLRDKRVVIVEDEGITQLQLKRILRSQGMEVVGTAADGQEAVTVVLETRPDVVVMDIKMPGIDGLEASEQILKEYPVCIVMLTAFSDIEYYQKADAIGTSGYIVKPISAETLLPQLLFAYRKFLRTKG
jgi:two-component system, response regulator PdtaR